METELWPVFGGREAFDEAPADITERHILAWSARKEAERITQERQDRELARQRQEINTTRRG